MNLAYLNGCFALVVMLWATWCVAVPGIVREGLGGQVVLVVVALSAFAVMVHGFMGSYLQAAEIAFNASIAGLVVRHWWLRVGGPWLDRWRSRRRA